MTVKGKPRGLLQDDAYIKYTSLWKRLEVLSVLTPQADLVLVKLMAQCRGTVRLEQNLLYPKRSNVASLLSFWDLVMEPLNINCFFRATSLHLSGVLSCAWQ